jgi:hypothetical protein
MKLHTKGILITGPGAAGKTTVARIIAGCFSNPFFIRYMTFGPHQLQKTPVDCFVIEEVPINEVENFIQYIGIGPKIILVSLTDHKLFLNEKTLLAFDVIEKR